MGADLLHRVRATGASLLALVLIAGVFGGSATAWAEPTDAEPPAAAGLTMPWTALGLSNTINLAGPNNNEDFTVPVPFGFTVQRLTGLMHAPINFGAGFMEIRDARGQSLAAVDLPPVSSNQAVVPFDVDISAARVTASALALSFTVRQVDGAGQVCGPEQRLEVTDMAMVFAGAEPAPTTIATFFPSVLSRVTIYVPADADRVEQESALSLSSALTRLYQPQPTEITVTAQPRGAEPPPSAPLSRAIVVERGDGGLDVLKPGQPDAYLRVSGGADQVSLLVDRLQSLAQVTSARITQAGAASETDSDTLSFGQLSMSGKTETLRSSNFLVGVDRSALGKGRVDGVQVHLLASYTPVAPQDAGALVVNVNGQALYTSLLDGSGRVNAIFDIPNYVLAQRINFDFRVTYSPSVQCNATLAPLTFQLDQRSTLTMHRGGEAGAKFSSLPSEFSPDFLVGLDGSSPDQLGYAARVVVAISRLTSTRLTPRVVDLKEAAESTTGALIVADAKTLEAASLKPPIGGNGSSIQVNLPEQVRADIDRGLGSIQVLADLPRNRTVVVVTTTGDWSLVNPVFEYLAGLPDGWSNLSGNVLAAGTQGAVMDMSIGLETPSIVADSVAAEAPRDRTWIPWLGVGVICLIAIGAAALWWRRRGSRAGDVW